MKQTFVPRQFSDKTMRIIERANAIIAEYQGMGFKLTLRQLYYQFVARAFIDNRQSEYKRLGSIINDARLAGLIDWEAIEDRTRFLRRTSTWTSPQSIIGAVARQYREDYWETQEFAPEVWIEKDALVGVIEGVCEEHGVPYFACRGNVSQSELYEAGKRASHALATGKTPIIFHLGDHDPNGIDMTRDNTERLELFCGEPVEVRRLALNMDQIRAYNPPPSPAKETDSRYAGYVAQFGDESWELDALDPPVISALIRDALAEIIDADAWDAAEAAETTNRELLERTSEYWPGVTEYLAGL